MPLEGIGMNRNCTLHKAVAADLPLFARMEQSGDAADFVIPYSLKEHQRKFANPDFVYLTVQQDAVIAGFLILVLDSDGRSVEFRRIVVARPGEGIGQTAIQQMEQFCASTLGRQRIWLDVFESNQRGRHIYEKLGYLQFSESFHHGKRLLLFEKQLSPTV